MNDVIDSDVSGQAPDAPTSAGVAVTSDVSMMKGGGPTCGETTGQPPFERTTAGSAEALPRPAESRLLARWRHRVGAVKAIWSKVSGSGSLPRADRLRQVVGVVQKRYSMTREEASRMARKLFGRE